ncbi:MAG: membrane protein insertion efficiency factor YidD [Candidatus Poribacteria bacterium]|nr:membrane protein insertion efficiency factor YidD [Candidatus Poribacteria bacterium]
MVNPPVYRMFVTFCVHCLLIVMFVSPMPANEAADLAFMRKFNPITTEKPQEVIRFNPEETSELKLAATGLIRLYQKFISSQDVPACGFSPTCSRFCMACIQEYGLVRGIFLAADRLLRCNGSQSRYYHKDEATGKYVDPVSDYATLK